MLDSDPTADICPLVYNCQSNNSIQLEGLVMPIGLVDDDQFQLELENLSNTRPSSHPSVQSVPSVQIVEKPSRGRNEGDVNVPDSLRQIIGETAVIDGRQSALALASMFDVSPSSVSAYANGSTSTKSYNSPASSIINHINKSRERAVKRASKTMNRALGAITQEKLDYADATDLSGIAKDMSVIIKNLEPPTPSVSTDNSTQQFVIYAPSFRKEESFDVIDVKE